MSVLRHPGLFLRSSITGTLIGMIPGIGGTAASFIAYGQAVQTARDRSTFGKGDIRGVLAPEAANDAKDGGSLVPTLAFGIPGSESTVLLLAAFALHGLVPGREILTDHLTLVFALIGAVLLANWLTSLVGLTLVNPLARFSVVRVSVLAPWVLGLATLGAYASRGRIEDVLLAFAFGAVGYLMKKHGWPRVPLVIALVLGTHFETHLTISLQLRAAGRLHFWSNPIILVLLVLTVVSLAYPYVPRRDRRCRKGASR